MNAEEIIGALGGMSPQERLRVAAVLAFFEDAPEECTGYVVSPEELLWRGYIRALKKQGVELISVHGARSQRGWTALVTAAKELEPWVQKHFEIQDETERVAAYNLIGWCVIKMLQDAEVPWFVGVLMRQACNATLAVELQFPDYAANGLLRRAL